MSDEKPVVPNITEADFWPIWLQLHFPGPVWMLTPEQVHAATFMPGLPPRPGPEQVAAWIEIMKIAFAGRPDMHTPSEKEQRKEHVKGMEQVAAGLTRVKDAAAK